MSSRRKQTKPRFLKAGFEYISSENPAMPKEDDIPSDNKDITDSESVNEDGDCISGADDIKQEPTGVSSPSILDKGDEPQLEETSNGVNEPNTESVCGDDEKQLDLPFSIGVTEDFPYGCVYCDKAFSKFSHVRDHEMIHSSEMPYQCDFCKRPFRHKRSRDRHMKLHTGDKNYKCNLCEAAFSRSDHLKNHLRSHTNRRWLPATRQNENEDYKYTFKDKEANSGLSLNSVKSPAIQCRLCKETFTNYYQLDEHLKNHARNLELSASNFVNLGGSSRSNNNNSTSGTRSLEYHCTHCAKQSLKQIFTSLSELEQHVTQMHSGKGLSLLSCPYCKAAFPTVPTLNDHIEQNHGDRRDSALITSRNIHSPELLSPQVSKRSRSSQNSTPDVNVQQYKNMDYVMCNMCSKPFASVAQVMTHMLSTHGARQQSSQPDRGTEVRDVATPLDLSSHSPADTQVFVCPLCGDNFSSIILLMEHNQKTHLDILESKCNVCSEVISTPEHHLDHMERHYLSTRRQYLCRCCKASFSLVDELQAHLIVEHSRRLFKCLLCNEMFHTEVDLKIHLTVEHSNENKMYRCACCGRDFDELTSWRTHILQAHIDLILPSSAVSAQSTAKDRMRCPYCTQSFSVEADLNIHILSHQKSFQCSLCPEKFAVEYLRDKHMQNTHSQQLEDVSLHSPKHSTASCSPRSPYYCTICDRIFHSEDVFEEHKRKSHSVTKTWLLKASEKSPTSSSISQTKMFSTACSSCGKSFKTYSELDKHSRIHFGPVSLTCVICDELCSSLVEMAKHKLQHCKVPAINPCILCPKEVLSSKDYIEHSAQHIESDSTVLCCVCKHKISSQVELELHAEFHFPKKSSLKCASCSKPCPYFVSLPPNLSQNPQFLLCQECLVARRDQTSVVIPNGMRLASGNTDARSPKSSSRQSTTSSPHSISNDHTTVGSQMSTPPKCSICLVKFETLKDMESHSCTMKQCSSCLKKVKESELILRSDTYLCVACNSIPQDMWKCDKCKLTFTREEKYQKHNCIALGDGKECKLCQGRFNHSQLLLRGSKLVCKKCDQNLLMCSHCKENYTLGEKHLCHLKCELCHQVYINVSGTKSQEKLCNICSERKTAECNIMNDERESHTDAGKVYQCIKCQKTCNSEDDIKRHVLTQHVNETSHKCYLCSSLFSTPAKLQTHLIDHNFALSSKMVCPSCPWETTSSTDMINHCISEHNVSSKSFACALCQQKFFFETELLNHTYSHHHQGNNNCHTGSNDQERSRDKPSKRPRSLDGRESPAAPLVKMIKSEVLSDNEIEDLFCSHCDTEFATAEQYNNHMKIKHQNSIVACRKCSKLYSCEEDLIEHQANCQHDGIQQQSELTANSSTLP